MDKKFRDKEVKKLEELIMTKIGLNVMEQEQNGESMAETKNKLQEYVSGQKTKQNVELFNQYYAEACGEVGLLQIPKRFEEFKEFVAKGVKKRIQDNFNEDPDKVGF